MVPTCSQALFCNLVSFRLSLSSPVIKPYFDGPRGVNCHRMHPFYYRKITFFFLLSTFMADQPFGALCFTLSLYSMSWLTSSALRPLISRSILSVQQSAVSPQYDRLVRNWRCCVFRIFPSSFSVFFSYTTNPRRASDGISHVLFFSLLLLLFALKP